MSLHLWLGFLAASLLIAVTPGPGAVLSMSTGLRAGYRVALHGILGLQLALLIQLAVVAVGLGALLAASETAFFVLKVVGALYLVWLGWQRWRAPVEAVTGAAGAPVGDIFRQAVLVNMTNPKAIVFICALVPQFIEPAAPLWPQYLVIGATLCGCDTLVMSCYALAGARVARWLARPGALRLQNRLFGGLFMSAGVALAASSRT